MYEVANRSKWRSTNRPDLLFRAEHAVPRIAKARNDIPLFIQVAIQCRSDDWDVLMDLFHAGNPLGRGQQA